jgi:hypothetical protein
MVLLLPQTAAEAYALGFADGYHGEHPLQELYTWETQDAYAAGYRAGRGAASGAGSRVAVRR